MTTRSRRTPRTKLRGSLKALAETHKSNTLLLSDIQRHAVKKSQADNSRRQDIIHPSEMAKEDWCPRATTYRLRGIKPTDPEEVHFHQLITIFEEGHEIHSKWQSWIGEMGRLWGTWYCPACGETRDGVGVLTCSGTEESPHPLLDMLYREVRLDAEAEWMIVGHADGAVPDLEAFIEVKSIGLGTLRIEEKELVRKYTLKTEDGKSVVDYDNLWKAIKRPLKSHRKQAGVYLSIAHLLGLPYTKMIFIYENKANQSTKEFVIDYSDDLVADLIDAAKDVKWAVETGRDLPRIDGATKDSSPCKTCPWKTWCYAEEEEDGAGTASKDVEDGRGLSGSEEETGSPADLHASAPRRVPRTAGRSDRVGRQRTDDADDPIHPVGRVPRSATGGSRGRRVPRRRVPRSG